MLWSIDLPNGLMGTELLAEKRERTERTIKL